MAKGLILDTDFKQGKYGDCQSLAVMKGILNTPGGAAYFDEKIHINGNGTYDVNFPGRKPVQLQGMILATQKSTSVMMSV